MSEPLLDVRGLDAFYSSAHVLHGITFSIGRESVAVVGRNGMGKSTLCAAIMGFTPPRTSGSVRFDGEELLGRPSHRIARAGIGYVPQGRRLFPSLTVDEHLTIAAQKNGAWTPGRVYELFPRLAERKRNGGAELSGGEQQMLAIGRALMSGPRLLIIDEAALGLAPVMVERVFEIVKEIRRDGNTVLLVEQNAPVTLALADRVYLMQRGKITTGGPAAEVREKGVLDAYLGPMAQAAKNLAKREEAAEDKPKKTGADLFTSSGGTGGAKTKKRAGKKGR
jgi:branched-chain amino acid transport system ATP-binding protein